MRSNLETIAAESTATLTERGTTAATAGKTALPSVHVTPRARQFEHGCSRLHFSFLVRHSWHETGSW